MAARSPRSGGAGGHHRHHLPLLLLLLLLAILLLLAASANASSCRSSDASPPRRHRRSRALKQEADAADAAATTTLRRRLADAAPAGYSLLGTAPVSVAHTHLIPGTRDHMLAMNYFDGEQSFPADGDVTENSGPVDRDGRTIARLFDRSRFSFGVVPVASNAVCGAWAPLSDGKIGMFAGHTPMGVQGSGFDNLYVYDPFDGAQGGIQDKNGLTRGRWYPGVSQLPNGRILVYGGSGDVDFNDPAPDGDLFTPSTNTVARTAAMPPFFADVAYGPYYPLIVALPRPSGAVLMALHSRAGVVIPETGEMLAEAPGFPAPYEMVVFEYPMSGSMVMSRSDPRLASFGAAGGAREARVEIILTGGIRDAAFWRDYKLCVQEERQLRDCSDAILSIGLTMTLQEDDSVAFAFDPEWRVAQMPPRCVHDAVLLPNNKVLIINGVHKGYAGLGECQLAHDPHNEPWIYDPATNEASATGHTTRIPRLYHGSAALTARGDVIVTGTTNTKGWTNSRDLPLDASAWASEYRVEAYVPSAIAQGSNRPVILRSPTTAFFADNFVLETDAPISAVVLSQPGGATHGMALNQRAQELAFEEEEGGGLSLSRRARRYRVTAPSSPANAPAGFYLLFVVAGDGDSYSESAWLLLRESRDAPLDTLPPGAVRVEEASSGFEEQGEEERTSATSSFQCGSPCVLRNGLDSAGMGSQGARLARGEEEGSPWSAVLLASGDVDAGALADRAASNDAEGSYAYVSFWARGAGGDGSGGAELTVAFADVAAVSAGATQTDQAVVAGTRATVAVGDDGEWRRYALPPVFLPRDAGLVRLVIGGAEVDVDDVETWASGTSTVVNAAFRAALRKAGAGGGAGAAGLAMGLVMGTGPQRNAKFLSAKARAFGVVA
jgi:hypothetical protein